MIAFVSLSAVWRAFARVPIRPVVLRRAVISREVAVGCSAGFLMLSAPAMAQISDNDDGPSLQGGILTTQVTEGRAWTAAVSLNSLYDSNFRRTSGPDLESALRITPSARVAAGLPVGGQQLFVGGNYGRDYTIGQPEFNRSRWNVGGGAGWRLGSRCSGVIGAETGQRLNLVFDQAEFTNNVRRTTAYALTANCASNGGLGFGGSFGRIIATNDRPESALFDVTSSLFNANIAYGSPTLGQFSLGGSFNNSKYPNRLVATTEGIISDGFTSWSGRLGYSRGLGSKLQLALGYSYNSVSARPTTVLAFLPDGSIVEIDRTTGGGSGYDLSLNYTVSSRISVNVSGSRSVRASPNAGALFTIADSVQGSMSYELGPSLTFSTGVNYRKASYRDAFASPDEPVARVSDNFLRIFGSLRYNPGSFYSVGLQVAHQQRNSNPSIYSFKGMTAILSLSANFGKG